MGSCSASGGSCGTAADCPDGETCNAIDGAGTGRTIFQWVEAFNADGFAGHSDWRIPNVRELQSIIDYSKAFPSVSAPFDTCTFPFEYWSSTSIVAGTHVWVVDFSLGNVRDGGRKSPDPNDFAAFVRAVRGGL